MRIIQEKYDQQDWLINVWQDTDLTFENILSGHNYMPIILKNEFFES